MCLLFMVSLLDHTWIYANEVGLYTDLEWGLAIIESVGWDFWVQWHQHNLLQRNEGWSFSSITCLMIWSICLCNKTQQELWTPKAQVCFPVSHRNWYTRRASWFLIWRIPLDSKRKYTEGPNLGPSLTLCSGSLKIAFPDFCALNKNKIKL